MSPETSFSYLIFLIITIKQENINGSSNSNTKNLSKLLAIVSRISITLTHHYLWLVEKDSSLVVKLIMALDIMERYKPRLVIFLGKWDSLIKIKHSTGLDSTQLKIDKTIKLI
jgi:hypothetical protein